MWAFSPEVIRLSTSLGNYISVNTKVCLPLADFHYFFHPESFLFQGKNRKIYHISFPKDYFFFASKKIFLFYIIPYFSKFSKNRFSVIEERCSLSFFFWITDMMDFRIFFMKYCRIYQKGSKNFFELLKKIRKKNWKNPRKLKIQSFR